MEWINILIILGILAAKVVEISLSSIKLIFLSQHQRLCATICAFMEVLVWAFVASGIITSLTTNLCWLFAYCFGYASGVFVGSLIEEKLAIGTACMQIVVEKSDEDAVIQYLTEHNCGYTKFNSEGAQTKSSVIMTVVAKKKLNHAIKDVKFICRNNVFIVVSNVFNAVGGTNVKTHGFRTTK